MKTIDPREFELAIKIEAAKREMNIDLVKSLTADLIAVQKSYPPTPPVSDDFLVQQAGVPRALLAEEHRLVAEIDKAKENGDTAKVAELTSRLILVQKEQPQVGARFG